MHVRLRQKTHLNFLTNFIWYIPSPKTLLLVPVEQYALLGVGPIHSNLGHGATGRQSHLLLEAGSLRVNCRTGTSAIAAEIVPKACGKVLVYGLSLPTPRLAAALETYAQWLCKGNSTGLSSPYSMFRGFQGKHTTSMKK